MVNINFPASPDALPRGTAPPQPPPPPVDLHPFEPPEKLFQRSPPKQAPEEAEPGRLDRQSIQEGIDHLNKLMDGLKSRLQFGLFEGTDQFYVKVVNRDNNRVVKIIPPEKLLELRQKLEEAVGLLLDEEM